MWKKCKKTPSKTKVKELSLNKKNAMAEATIKKVD